MTVHSSIENRRRLGEETLQRIGYGPGIELASFPAGQQRKIEKVLGELRKLTAIETTCSQAQIELYGERRWRGEFSRLADLEVAPGTRFTGARLQALVWDALPDGPFKRFQDAFVAARDRIVPHASIQRIDGRRVVSFAPEFDPKRASVLPCLVSPDRVSEKLLESLAIVDFAPLDRKPVERLERKGSLEVVTTLKRVWDGAAPLADRHYRVLVVGRRDDTVEERYHGFPLPTAAKGKLLVVRRPVEEDPGFGVKNGGAGAHRTLQIQIFDGPGPVLRRIHYLGAGYTRELEVLRGVHARLAHIHGELGSWSDLDRKARTELRIRLAETVLQAVSELEASVDFSKQRARELMAEVRIEDKRNRDNPPRAQLVLMRAIEKITDRLERARSKEGFIKIDERAVEGAMIHADRVLLDYGGEIAHAAPKLAVQHYLFSPRAKPEAVGAQAQGLLKSLRLDPAGLQALDLQPYRAFGEALVERHAQLGRALERRDRSGAQDILVSMHVVAKLYLVVREVERLKIQLARNPDFTCEGVRNGVVEVLRRFDERDIATGRVTSRIFPERRIAGLDEPFAHVRQGLRELLDEAVTAGLAVLGGGLSPAAELLRKEGLRERLDSFGRGGRYDLGAALRQLP